ncbi:MAG: hypothetical protein OEY49_18080, partial [Candidatus Heimdallarchaeota archaeon]|nr:hypothetical protein [Candidatus Heimdallarchaeota archaeon]
GALGFETMERSGITLTSHRHYTTTMIIISSNPLPLSIMNQLQEAHVAIEEKYKKEIDNEALIQDIPSQKIFNIMTVSSLKVELKGFIKIHDQNIKKAQNKSSISRNIRSNLALLSEFNQFATGANVPITLVSLIDFLKSKNIPSDVIARMVMTAYAHNILFADIFDDTL